MRSTLSAAAVQLCDTLVDFPPLGHEPLREKFGTPLKSIKTRA